MEHWIYLQLLLGYGCINTRRIIENIKDISKIHKFSDSELSRLGVPKTRISKRSSITIDKAKNILSQCIENKILVIPYSDRRYPQKLKLLDNPPVVLYAVGNLPDFDNRLCVAVVGPRDISEYGGRAAFSLSARLALAGALVISGGAVGGDFYAHQGAMAVGEPTVNVTGGGLLSGYLKANKILRKDILMGGGLLVSEFVPDYVPRIKNSFHLRNRIIAGLSDVVSVIEAPEESGALITAHEAMEQGKEVFAFSGDDSAEQYAGCRSLILDGAAQLNSPRDILSRFSNYMVNYEKMDSITNKHMQELYAEFLQRQHALEEYLAKKKSEKKSSEKEVSKETPIVKQKPKFVKAPEGLDPQSMLVFEALNSEGMFADEIVLNTNLSTGVVLTALTMLEVKGLVEALPGSRYRLKID